MAKTYRYCDILVSIAFLVLLLAFFGKRGEAQTEQPSEKQIPQASVPISDTGSITSDASHAASTDFGESALRLSAGDLIDVSVYNVPELTTKVRINTSGDIYLPLVDYVHISGLTAETAQELIQKKLADGGFLKDPHVTIFVDEYNSQGANLLGEVAKPGVYPVLGKHHLFDLLSEAGGLTDRAGKSITVTRHNQSDKPITVALRRNLNEVPDSNIDVFPGDTITVRRADIVYVVGEVTKPSGFLMESGHVTILQAIALAGGTTPTASLGGARILRRTPTGIVETPVALKKMLRAKSPDLPMEADDILFIPTSAGKIAAKRTVDTAVSLAGSAALLTIRP